MQTCVCGEGEGGGRGGELTMVSACANLCVWRRGGGREGRGTNNGLCMCKPVCVEKGRGEGGEGN